MNFVKNANAAIREMEAIAERVEAQLSEFGARLSALDGGVIPASTGVLTADPIDYRKELGPLIEEKLDEKLQKLNGQIEALELDVLTLTDAQPAPAEKAAPAKKK